MNKYIWFSSTEGFPGCTCRVLLDGPTTVPHTEACRGRIIGQMVGDETGKERLEAHERRRKRQKDAPMVAEQDVAAPGAAGEPTAVAIEEPQDPIYPEDPEIRERLKRAVETRPTVRAVVSLRLELHQHRP